MLGCVQLLLNLLHDFRIVCINSITTKTTEDILAVFGLQPPPKLLGAQSQAKANTTVTPVVQTPPMTQTQGPQTQGKTTGLRVMADDLGQSRRLTGGSGYFRCRPRVVASHKRFFTDA